MKKADALFFGGVAIFIIVAIAAVWRFDDIYHYIFSPTVEDCTRDDAHAIGDEFTDSYGEKVFRYGSRSPGETPIDLVVAKSGYVALCTPLNRMGGDPQNLPEILRKEIKTLTDHEQPMSISTFTRLGTGSSLEFYGTPTWRNFHRFTRTRESYCVTFGELLRYYGGILVVSGEGKESDRPHYQ